MNSDSDFGADIRLVIEVINVEKLNLIIYSKWERFSLGIYKQGLYSHTYSTKLCAMAQYFPKF